MSDILFFLKKSNWMIEIESVLEFKHKIKQPVIVYDKRLKPNEQDLILISR